MVCSGQEVAALLTVPIRINEFSYCEVSSGKEVNEFPSCAASSNEEIEDFLTVEPPPGWKSMTSLLWSRLGQDPWPTICANYH